MTTPYLYTPVFRHFDQNGEPAAGYKLHTYVAGGTTLKNTYSDAAGLVANANPITLDSTGSAVVRLEPGAYHFVCNDPTDTTTDWDADYYTAPFLTAANIGLLLYPQSATEILNNIIPANNQYPEGNALRYGIVPNDSTTPTMNANTAALKTLFTPGVTGFVGNFWFPNTSGADTYYFNDLIAIRDGILIDGRNCTISFIKSGVAGDSACGFFHCIRNVTIQNMTININYTNNGAANAGNAIGLGVRGTDVLTLFPATYDSLVSPQGNITLRNLHISSNAGGAQARCILAAAGLTGVILENIWCDGQGVNLAGLYYEFGWATNEANEYQRQTSHAHNWNVTNFNVKGVTATAFEMRGAYNITIDDIKAYTSGGIVAFSPGEALYYRPWTGVDGAGVKAGIFVRNAVGNVTGTAIDFEGSSSITASYLNGPGANNPNGLTSANQTDLLEFTLENANIVGTVGGYGIQSTAGRATIRGCKVSGFQRGIVTSQECTNFLIQQCEVLNSTGLGMAIGQAINTIYSPARQSTGKIIDCFVAGSGTAGASAAISVGTTISCNIENCRFGYETIHDGISESTQLHGVTVAADAFGVQVNNCYVAAVSAGVAYNLNAGNTSRNCSLNNCSGVTTTTGIWENTLDTVSADNGDAGITYTAHTMPRVQLFATTLTANRTVTLSTTNAVAGDKARFVRTGLGAQTLAIGALKTIPNSVAAFVDIEFNGTSWLLVAYGTL